MENAAELAWLSRGARHALIRKAVNRMVDGSSRERSKGSRDPITPYIWLILHQCCGVTNSDIAKLPTRAGTYVGPAAVDAGIRKVARLLGLALRPKISYR